MKQCENCGVYVRDDAKICPRCDCILDQYTFPYKAKKVAGKFFDHLGDRIGLLFCVAVFAIIFVFSLFGVSKGTDSAERSKPSTQKPDVLLVGEDAELKDYEAFLIAKEIVNEQLKSPSTAEFCDIRDAKIVHLADGEYEVVGWVDSQNGFGAMLRTKFLVLFTPMKKGYDLGYKNASIFFE